MPPIGMASCAPQRRVRSRLPPSTKLTYLSLSIVGTNCRHRRPSWLPGGITFRRCPSLSPLPHAHLSSFMSSTSSTPSTPSTPWGVTRHRGDAPHMCRRLACSIFGKRHHLPARSARCLPLTTTTITVAASRETAHLHTRMISSRRLTGMTSQA